MMNMIEKAKGKSLKDYICFVFGYLTMCFDRYKLSKIKPVTSGVTKVKRKIPIIVSLTSFPPRIKMVAKCIDTLLCQSIKPDKVILWLAYEQFPEKYDNLPEELLNLQQYGLEIRWCSDIKSYKKLIPTVKEFKDCIIVTTDDDLLYDSNWLELLYETYQKNPNNIICHRITKVYWENEQWCFTTGGKDVYNHPSYLNKLVGCGGVLYPPGSLSNEVTKEEAFMRLAPTNDDVWFWCMGVLNGYKVLPAYNRIRWNKEIKGTSASALSNLNAQAVVREQLENVLDAYPIIRERLMKEVFN